MNYIRHNLNNRYQLDIYNSNLFKKILEEVYHIREIKIFNSKEMNQLCSFFISRKPFKKNKIFNMPIILYHFPNLKEKEDSFFRELNEYSKQKKVTVIFKSLIKHNIKSFIHNFDDFFLHLNFDGYEEYFNSLSKNFRQNIRTLYNRLGRNFELKHIDCNKELSEFYKILSNMYIDKHKMLFQPYRLFERLFEEKLAEFLIYKNRINRKVIAGIVYIKDGNMIHYVWGATSSVFYKFSPNTLLVNELINICFKDKIKILDFGISPKDSDKMLFFKSRWGCKHLPFYEYYFGEKPRIIDYTKSFILARKIYSKFPKAAIRCLMPKIVPWLI